MMDKNSKIAIIGAGIGGLVAADALKAKGYKDIVIYEALDRIGGKLRSVERDGYHYEMGGVFIPETFTSVKALMKRHRYSLTEKMPLSAAIYFDGSQHTNFNYGRNKYGFTRLLRDLFGLYKLVRKDASLDAANHYHVPQSQYQSLEQMLSSSLPYTVAPFLTGMGYGYTDRTPAFYQLKLIKRVLGFAAALEINSNLGLSLPVTYYAKGGYQAFAEKIAKLFTVHINTPVISLQRGQGGGSITLKTSRSDEKYDVVIVAVTPKAALKFMDFDAADKALYLNTRSFYFHSSLFYAQGLPSDKMLFFPEALKNGNIGQVSCLVNWHPEHTLFSAYQLNDGSVDANNMNDLLVQRVTELGGRIIDITMQEVFDYFPHYSPRGMQTLSPYSKLETMQGKGNTYFVGGFLAGESVNDVVRFSGELVERYF